MENEMKRVIDINLDLTNSSLQGNEPVKTSRIFYTTDIGTSHLRFTSKNEISNSTASIVLKNITDGSKIQKNIAVTEKIFSYILGEEIEHAGDWIGQVIIEKDDKSLTSRSFKFQINGGLLSSSKPSLSDVDDYNKLYKQLNGLNDEMVTYLETATLSEQQRLEAENVRNNLFEKFEENERQRLEAEANRISLFTEFEKNEEVRKNNELNREETYEIKIDSAIIEADLVTKVNDKVTELTPTIQQVTAQLAQTAKSTDVGDITLLDSSDKTSLVGALNSNLVGEKGKKYKNIAGVLRNTGTGWQFIEDGTHSKMNLISVTATGTGITINYGFTAKKVLSLVATADDFYIRQGVLVGASVGTSSAILHLSGLEVGGYVYFNGTDWVLPPYVTSSTFQNGILTLNHQNLGLGNIASLTGRDGGYMPQLSSVAGHLTQVKFYNWDGTLVTTPDTNMKLFFHRRGTLSNGSLNPELFVSTNGNIWLMGIFEV